MTLTLDPPNAHDIAFVDPAAWPVVLTVDDVAAVLRHDDLGKRESRRAVYDLVRSGAIVPLGEATAGKLTPRLRFSRRDVLDLIGVA